jgi:hypothetical protein
VGYFKRAQVDHFWLAPKYQYVDGNPLMFVDPKGLGVEEFFLPELACALNPICRAIAAALIQRAATGILRDFFHDSTIHELLLQHDIISDGVQGGIQAVASGIALTQALRIHLPSMLGHRSPP